MAHIHFIYAWDVLIKKIKDILLQYQVDGDVASKHVGDEPEHRILKR